MIHLTSSGICQRSSGSFYSKLRKVAPDVTFKMKGKTDLMHGVLFKSSPWPCGRGPGRTGSEPSRVPGPEMEIGFSLDFLSHPPRRVEKYFRGLFGLFMEVLHLYIDVFIYIIFQTF